MFSRGRFRRRRFPTRFRRGRRSFSRKGPVSRASFDQITLFNNLDMSHNSPFYADPIFGCGPLIYTPCSQSAGDCGTGVPGCSPPSNPDPNDQDTTCVCCVTTAQLEIFGNNVLESFYQDAVTIVRMSGDLYFQSVLNAPIGPTFCSNPQEVRSWQTLYSQTYGENIAIGIRKKLLSQDQQEQAVDTANPGYGFDWTESSPPWLWQRNKLWYPRNTLYRDDLARQSQLGCCGDTSGGLALNALAAGTGNIDTSVSTDCTPCIPPNEDGTCPQPRGGQSNTLPPMHHFRIFSRKHIRMARDQSLNVLLAVRHPSSGGSVFGWTCNNKSDWLLDSYPQGNPFGVNYRVFLRLKATVRLH